MESTAGENQLPVFGICGYSGAGKTTLIEQLLPRFKRRGWKIAVIKHDAHGLDIDREGKDSDRFFQAGADVLAYGPGEGFLRMHRDAEWTLNKLLNQYAPFYDLILVEGHKFTPLPKKIWLLGEDEEKPPADAQPIVQILKRQDDRVKAVEDFIVTDIEPLWRTAPVNAGILIGGRSRRMGTPKHLLQQTGRTWLEQALMTVKPLVRQTVILGHGDLPASLTGNTIILPDCEDYRGPLRGMIAAMRWKPKTCWLFAACDLPMISKTAVNWLLSHRAPGVWAIIPRQESGQIEPLFAYYDFRIRPILETLQRPQDAAAAEHVLTPTIPPHLSTAWTNVNTPDALNLICDPKPSRSGRSRKTG